VIADTCWFIDLEKRKEPAIEFLRRHPNTTFALVEIVRAELHAGGRDFSRITEIVAGADVLPINGEVARIWGESARALRARGEMIGANDLWIAALSIAHRVPVLTRNVADFERVPGVDVVPY
jgi:tRNA(fMet)-specific endonuclease VapC